MASTTSGAALAGVTYGGIWLSGRREYYVRTQASSRNLSMSIPGLKRFLVFLQLMVLKTAFIGYDARGQCEHVGWKRNSEEGI